MKKLLILIVVLVFGAECIAHDFHNPVSQDIHLKGALSDDAIKYDFSENRDVPEAFKKTDFKNLTYPVSLRRKPITLKNGKFEYREGIGGNSFELEGVDYADINGDTKKEAIVQLFQLSCGGSCDGGSHLFYFYAMKSGRLTLLSRIETGSLAYGECGLRSFSLRNSRLVLETFHVCRFDGLHLKPGQDSRPNSEAKVGKFIANKFTRFRFEFAGRTFKLRRREVLRNADEEIMNYRSKIEISND